jgi:hypothetical protein
MLSQMESCAKVKKTFVVAFAAFIFSTVVCVDALNVPSSFSLKLVQTDPRKLEDKNETTAVTVAGETTFDGASVADLGDDEDDFTESTETTLAAESGADEAEVTSIEDASGRMKGLVIGFELTSFLDDPADFQSVAEGIQTALVDSIKDGSFLDTLQQTSSLDVVDNIQVDATSLSFEPPTVNTDAPTAAPTEEKNFFQKIIAFIIDVIRKILGIPVSIIDFLIFCW